MDDAPKKALGYVRISSTRQINNESPETQKQVIQDYAARNNIEVIEWFYDEAKSGKNADRQELQNLIKFAYKYKGKIDFVIVYNMRRASRDLESYHQQIRGVLRAKGIVIRSATEPAVNDTKEGRFMETLLVALGQLDNEGKAEVTVDNMRSLAMQGYWQHPPLHGYDSYKIPNELGKLRPSMKPNGMADKVRGVLERFSQGDITKAELARYASDIGLRSKNNKVLTDTSIKKLLTTPEYAGYVHDKFTEYELVEGKHPGLISKDTYERNQFLLQKNNRNGEPHLKNNPLFPLKGLLLCGYCQKTLYASSPRNGSGGYSPRYHCSRASCRGKAKSIGIDMIHGDFKKLLKRVKPNEGVLRLYKQILIREANNDVQSLNKRIAYYRNELDEIAAQRAKTINKFIDEQLTISEKDEFIEVLDAKKVKVTGDLKELENQQTLRETDIELAISVMGQVDRQWEESDLDLKVRFQSMLFPEGVVYDFINRRFGTAHLSPLYRCITTKKGAKAPSNSNLVAGAGIAPATSWL